MNPFSLQGQTALVTGANTGIGQAIAVAMAQAGADVIAAGRRDCDETLALMGSGRQMRLDFADPMAAPSAIDKRPCAKALPSTEQTSAASCSFAAMSATDWRAGSTISKPSRDR